MQEKHLQVGGEPPEYIDVGLSMQHWHKISPRGSYEQVSMHARQGGSVYREERAKLCILK